jgi:hypothetical protein
MDLQKEFGFTDEEAFLWSAMKAKAEENLSTGNATTFMINIFLASILIYGGYSENFYLCYGAFLVVLWHSLRGFFTIGISHRYNQAYASITRKVETAHRAASASDEFRRPPSPTLHDMHYLGRASSRRPSLPFL